MKTAKHFWLSLALIGICRLHPGLALAAQEGALDPRHVEFLKDVDAILTTPERELFSILTEPAARDLFVEMFWKARDPTPGTERNEGREEHLRRLRYARRRLGDDTPRDGAITDRGRTYILLGEPIRIERYPGNRSIYPTELWFYSAQGNTRLPPYFYMMFYRPFETGEHKLYIPGVQNPGDLTASSIERRTEPEKALELLRAMDVELAYAAVSSDATKKSGQYRAGDTITFSHSVAAAVEQVPNDTVDTSYVKRFRPDGSVDTEATFNFVEMDWLSRAYLHEDGQMHLHYGLQLLPRDLGVGQKGSRYYAGLLLAGSVTRPGKTTEIAADLQDGVEIDLSSAQFQSLQARPFAYLSRHLLLPGRYELHMVLRNNTSRQAARAEEQLEVPDPASGKPLLTAPLLLSGTEREPTREDGLQKPFQIGELRLVPKLRREVHPEETVQLYSQLLPGSRRSEAAGWTARLEMLRDGQSLRTEDQAVASAPKGPSGSIHVLFAVPAEALARGRYELRLSVLDTAGKPVASGSETMLLASDAASPPWQSAKRRPGPDSEPVRLELARQLLLLGRIDAAADTLGPIAARFQYTEGPLQSVEWQICVTMAEAARKKGNLAGAAVYLERALAGAPPTPQLFADLGRVRLDLGDRVRTRAAWQRSLELEPDQPELAKELQALQP